jgi:hypothetical protein
LHDKRDDVLRVALEVHVRAIVDPESQHDSGSDEQLVDTSEATTDGTGSVLRDYDVSARYAQWFVLAELTVQWCDHGSSTDTQTSDEPAHENGCDVTRCSSLHDCSDDGENSGEDQVVAATDPVGNKAGG